MQYESTEQNILNTAISLINIRSTDTRPEMLRKVIDEVVLFFKPYPFHVTTFDFEGVPSVLISTKKSKHIDILLNGHLDVVEGYDSQFEAFVEGDYLYGRGAVDMKLYDAVAMHALVQLYEQNNDIDAGIYLSADEEIGGQNGAKKFVEAGYSSRILINGDAGVDYALVTGSKGILRFTMKAKTEPGRLAYPWEGKNAVDILLQAYTKIINRFPLRDTANAEDNWYSTYNVSKLESIAHPSGVPHEANMILGINYVDDLTPQELFQELSAMVPEISMEMVNIADRLEVDDSHPIYQRFQESAEKAFNREFVRKKDNGSSDAKFFKHNMEQIIIVKMPGDGAHEPDERARIDGIMPMFNTLVEFSMNESELMEKEPQNVEMV